MMGFMILNCILGGETLSAASLSSAADSSGMSWDVGIVIVSIISLFISFCGYRVLNIYERYAWIPSLIVFVIMLGVSGRHLTAHSDLPPATARQILSFGSTITGFVISYCGIAADFTTYMRTDVPSWKVFGWTYAGFFIPIVPIQILGAAFAASIPGNPLWQEAYDTSGLSGLLHAIAQPAGLHFSRFLLVLIAFSVTANIAPTLYSFSLSLQVLIPFNWVVRIPRYFLSTLATAILLPLAIVGSTHFYETLANFLGLLGYWCSCFGAVVCIEHLLFRRGRFDSYHVADWDQPRKLPLGIAAILSSIVAVGSIVPFMDQVWWVGPVAKTSGDIGFEIGFVVAGLSYIVLRPLEKTWWR
jgi:NCS1 nucleoside transporter family